MTLAQGLAALNINLLKSIGVNTRKLTTAGVEHLQLIMTWAWLTDTKIEFVNSSEVKLENFKFSQNLNFVSTGRSVKVQKSI